MAWDLSPINAPFFSFFAAKGCAMVHHITMPKVPQPFARIFFLRCIHLQIWTFYHLKSGLLRSDLKIHLAISEGSAFFGAFWHLQLISHAGRQTWPTESRNAEGYGWFVLTRAWAWLDWKPNIQNPPNPRSRHFMMIFCSMAIATSGSKSWEGCKGSMSQK